MVGVERSRLLDKGTPLAHQRNSRRPRRLQPKLLPGARFLASLWPLLTVFLARKPNVRQFDGTDAQAGNSLINSYHYIAHHLIERFSTPRR
jgi:hypothetical protein